MCLVSVRVVGLLTRVSEDDVMRDKSGVNVRKILFSGMVLLALGMAAPAPASAAPITGVLNITGSVIAGSATIDWYNPALGGFGLFSTTAPGTEYFSTIVNPASPPGAAYFGTAIDLSAPPVPVNDFLRNFMAADPKYNDLAFDLDAFLFPVAPPCDPTHVYAVNESCSLGLFTLTQGSAAVEARLEIAGSFEDPTFGDDGSLNRATGIYTSQGALVICDDPACNIHLGVASTIQQVVVVIDRGDYITASYSGAYNATAVPEPATLLTFGLGTAALGVHRRRRAKKLSKG
jgi:hypothetical protein